MRLIVTLLLFIAITEASSINLVIESVSKNRATVASHPQLQIGISGYIIHKIDDNHTAIIADGMVEQIDSTDNKAIISLSPYSGTTQESLPSIKNNVHAGDSAIFASDYTRALVIAPDEDTYDTITKNLSRLEFIHPDIFAAHLSTIGHPTPQIEDFKEFCISNSIGLLYIQSSDNLYTLDCKSFKTLQSTQFQSSPNTKQRPFYSRVENIRAAWWGSGSSKLDNYEPYYTDIINKHNKD